MDLREKDFYTTNELAKLLKISRISVFKRIGRGNIKAQKFGRNFIIFKKDIDIEKLKKDLRS
jgi:excisionase family DNA binding protein